MLIYNNNIVFDTDDSTKTPVTESDLIKILSLGVEIEGVKLLDNGAIQYTGSRTGTNIHVGSLSSSVNIGSMKNAGSGSIIKVGVLNGDLRGGR